MMGGRGTGRGGGWYEVGGGIKRVFRGMVGCRRGVKEGAGVREVC